MTLPDSSWSTLRSMNVPISSHLAAAGRAELLEARDLRVKRTQRVQWMQRVMSVEISGPRFLSFTTRLRSSKREMSRAEAERQVLQLALAALVADRAVERMVDQQEFHRRLLRGDRAAASA